MKWWMQPLRLMGIGWYIAFCIIFSLLLGLWIDDKVHTRPLFTLMGLVLGLVTAFLGVYRMVLFAVKDTRGKGDD